ncbi:hypothetical protein [Nisaea sediminum]|uniref:hypothetical protein n=1 Tax=Nisaea sediminum TaxID=2775867 RepID=UPI00186822C2|nr:hypothetical protein [Nisaea sediminum]
MRTQEAELLAIVESAEREHEDLTAIVIDLSSIPHIGDPIFFRTLIARINIAPGDLYRLPHHLVALVTPNASAAKTVAAIDRLGEFLKRSGRGEARRQQFRLSTEAAKLTKLCKRLIAEQPDTPRPGGEDSDLEGFFSLFESLSNADISNLVREQTIWDLSKPHDPVPMAGALTVSIDVLDDMFGQDIRANPWLFEKIIEVIDVRMLDHLIDDRMKTGKTYTVNVNSAVVNEGELDEAFDSIPMNSRKRVILEVPYVEALHERGDFDAMVDILEREHFPIALDGVRWTSLSKLEVDPARFAFVKFMWDQHLNPENAADWTAFTGALERLGPENCIVFNCIDERAIPPLEELGLVRFQGRAVDDFIRHDRAELQKAHVQQSAREDVADETGDGKAQGGIMGKLFG